MQYDGIALFSNDQLWLAGDFNNAEHRNKVGRVLGIGPEQIPSQDSWPYDL
jgi:hypothetical protein